MSFANEVKKELLSLEDVATCCKKAMVLGILQGGCNIVFYQWWNKISYKIASYCCYPKDNDNLKKRL